MGIFDIFGGNQNNDYTNNSNIMNIKSIDETRSNADFIKNVQEGGYVPANNVISVSEKSVLTIPAVNACLEIITGSISSLDVCLYKRNPAGDIERILNDKRLFLLNNECNEVLSAQTMKKALVKDFLLHGKGFLKVEWNNNEVQELHLLSANRVTLDRYYEGYMTKYRVKYYADGGLFDFDSDEVLTVLRDSSNGIDSVGLLDSGKNIFKLALSELLYTSNVFENGALPIGILKTQGRLSKDAIVKLKNSWQNLYSRGAKTGASTVVLEEGLDYTPVSLSPQSLDLSNSRKTTLGEIARLFNISESLINPAANKYNSLEMNNLHYLQYCLFPILKTITTALNKYLLLEDEKDEYFFAFDTSNVLQSTDQEKFASLNTAVTSGLISINEARTRLNMNKLEKNDFFKWTLGAVLYDAKTNDVVIPNLGMATTLEKMKETQDTKLDTSKLQQELIEKEINKADEGDKNG